MSRNKLVIILVGIAFVAVGFGILFSLQSLKNPAESLQKMKIAVISPSYSAYTIYVAADMNFFRQEGLDVALDSYPNGNATLSAVMEGHAEMGTCSETPFMHAVFNKGNIYALASMITGENHLGVVARKDKGITKPRDLIGKSIGVTIGTNGEFFLDNVLLLNEVAMDQVTIVDIPPGKMMESIINEKVDAVATWNPQMFMAKEKLGDKGVVFHANGFYSPYFLIVGRQEYVKANPDVAIRFVRALIKASLFINENQDRSRKIVSEHLKIDPSLLERISGGYNFKISLEQALLTTLVNQSKWAIKSQHTDHTKIPNFLEYIYMDALLAVEPNRVNIIH